MLIEDICAFECWFGSSLYIFQFFVHLADFQRGFILKVLPHRKVSSGEIRLSHIHFVPTPNEKLCIVCEIMLGDDRNCGLHLGP